MAMDTNTSTDPVDLINNLHAFLLAQGTWTIDSFAVDGSGKLLILDVDGVKIIIRAVVNETVAYSGSQSFNNISGLFAYASDVAYNGANAWNRQTGGPLSTTSQRIPAGIKFSGAVPSYHFFSFDSPDTCYIIVEVAAGVFQTMGFGQLVKIGDWDGGQYFFGVAKADGTVNPQSANWIGGASTFLGGQNQGYVYMDGVDGLTGWTFGNRNGNIPGGSVTCYDIWQFSQTLVGALPILYNSETGLLPNILSKDGAGGWRPMGYFKEAFLFNLKNHAPKSNYSPGGGVNYRAFPYWNRNDNQPGNNFSIGLVNQTSTGYFGFAIKV